ncbi:MAG: hypothetical protein OEZ57_08410 [Nitrospirota bacterium]|nr:hypothetical protein [Nitrospirota bacterium]
MFVSLTPKILSLILAWAIFPALGIAQASDPRGIMSVALEKSLQFQDPNGEDVLVPQGTYSVKAGDYQITLESLDGNSFSLDATEEQHQIEVPFPMALIPSGTHMDLPHADLLVLLYPDGHSLQALGSEPQIVSRAIPDNLEEFLDYTDPETITLEQPAYFTGPDGSPILVEAGMYTAKATQSWIRLVPGNNPQHTLLLDATQGTHETGILDPLALSLPGGILHELDVHQILLLLPTGTSLEATGTYSGIETRGLFNKKRPQRTQKRQNLFKAVGAKFKQATKNPVIQNINKGINKGVKTGLTTSKVALAKTKAVIEKGSQAVIKGAKWVGKNGPALACKTLFKAPGAVAKLVDIPLKFAKEQMQKVRNDAKLLDKIATEVENFQKQQQAVIDTAVKSALKFNKPENLQKLKPFSSIDGICERGVPSLKRTIDSIVKKESQVRSRGGFHAYSLGMQLGGTWLIGGAEGGLGGAWNADETKGYWFAGLTGQMTQASAKAQIQFGAWESLQNLQGGYTAVGFTVPLSKWAKIANWVPGEQGVPPFKGGGGKEINIGIDFFIGLKPHVRVVGVVVGPGVGAGLANSVMSAGPLGRITLQGGGGGHF